MGSSKLEGRNYAVDLAEAMSKYTCMLGVILFLVDSFDFAKTVECRRWMEKNLKTN